MKFIKEINRINGTVIKDSIDGNNSETDSIKSKIKDKRTAVQENTSSTSDNDLNARLLEAEKAAKEIEQKWETDKKSFSESLQKALDALAETNNKLEQLTTKNQSLESEFSKAKESAETETIARQKLEDLLKMTGSQNTSTVTEQLSNSSSNRQTNTSSSEAYSGAVKELLEEYSHLPKVQKFNKQGGIYESYDTTVLDRFVRENRKQFIKDMEAWGKKLGYFRGTGAIVSEAPTTRSDIPSGFLTSLSSLMRTNNRPGFIFWQFPDYKFEFDKGNGDTIQIPRAAYNASPTTPNDRLLSGGGTFTPINANSQNVSAGAVSCQLFEWGLGNSATFAPIAIPSFVSSYSLLDLMNILDRNLLYDYYVWEDMRIRSLWQPTSRIVYNDRNSITATPGNVTAGDIGTMTPLFLNELYGYMRSQQIPTFPDGKYGIAMPSLVATRFKGALETYYNPPTPQDLSDLTEILNPGVLGGEDIKVQGYVGDYYNFRIFDSNSFGTGAAGTEGVQNETLGVGSTLTRTSYAFGANTIGRGVGMPFEIRRDSNDDFQRSNRYIWTSHEGFVAMDVDAVGYSDTSAVPQQTRVVQVRTTDVTL